MKTKRTRNLAGLLVGSLLLPATALAYQVGDTTEDWTLTGAYKEVSHRLLDYRGKLILMNLFRDS